MNNNLLEAIREKCLDCCCGDSLEVQLCTCKDCSLFPYRFGQDITIKNEENDNE